jgi:hypothetical protein
MTFNWYEYLLLAQYLDKDIKFNHPEALQRSAVSRAYYAAFCSAREYATSKYKTKFQASSDVHLDVRILFSTKNRKDISDNLNDLRLLRNKCDYNNDVKNLHAIVNQAIQLADEIISGLQLLGKH